MGMFNTGQKRNKKKKRRRGRGKVKKYGVSVTSSNAVLRAGVSLRWAVWTEGFRRCRRYKYRRGPL